MRALSTVRSRNRPPAASLRRGLTLAALSASLALTLSACGSKQDVVSAAHTKPFTVVLDGYRKPDIEPA